jgi:hypothetical protein
MDTIDRTTQAAWQERYESGRTGWDRGGQSPALVRWLEDGVLTGRVLVPGCGRGYEVGRVGRSAACPI